MGNIESMLELERFPCSLKHLTPEEEHIPERIRSRWRSSSEPIKLGYYSKLIVTNCVFSDIYYHEKNLPTYRSARSRYMLQTGLSASQMDQIERGVIDSIYNQAKQFCSDKRRRHPAQLAMFYYALVCGMDPFKAAGFAQMSNQWSDRFDTPGLGHYIEKWGIPLFGRLNNEQLYRIVHEEFQAFIHEIEPQVGRMVDRRAEQCILDSRRTKRFMEQVSAYGHERETGVDLGAGTGILGLTFLNMGGKKLYAVEKEELLCQFMKRVANRLGFSSRFQILTTDATTVNLSEKADYVIAELIHTAGSQEPLVAAILNSRQYITSSTRFLPSKIVTDVLIKSGLPILGRATYDVLDLTSVDCLDKEVIVDVPITQSGTLTTIEYHSVVYPGELSTEDHYVSHTLGVLSDLGSWTISSQLQSGGYRRHTVFVQPGDTVRLRINSRYGQPIPKCEVLDLIRPDSI
ncbi:50S ribosomal protein L11 methyltransferase [Candidatus Woesearchaeota archaeon]|nr:50S ribosomal protein L11 methyltransferase [Candidatus Woesearchaeota archaeon]